MSLLVRRGEEATIHPYTCQLLVIGSWVGTRQLVRQDIDRRRIEVGQTYQRRMRGRNRAWATRKGQVRGEILLRDDSSTGCREEIVVDGYAEGTPACAKKKKVGCFRPGIRGILGEVNLWVEE